MAEQALVETNTPGRELLSFFTELALARAQPLETLEEPIIEAADSLILAELNFQTTDTLFALGKEVLRRHLSNEEHLFEARRAERRLQEQLAGLAGRQATIRTLDGEKHIPIHGRVFAGDGRTAIVAMKHVSQVTGSIDERSLDLSGFLDKPRFRLNLSGWSLTPNIPVPLARNRYTKLDVLDKDFRPTVALEIHDPK